MNTSKLLAEKIALLKSSDIFSGSSDAFLVRLAKKAVWQEYPTGKIVFEKDDPSDFLYIIEKGFIEVVVISEEGKEILLNIQTSKECFGEIGFFDRQPRTATTAASSKTKLLCLSYSEWKSLENDLDPQSWMAIIKVMCRRLRRSSSHIEESHLFNTKSRIIFLLNRLLKEEKICSDEDKFLLNISQEKLSQMLGVTREITNKILSQLEDDKIIVRGHMTIKIVNSDFLQHFTKRGRDGAVKLYDVA